MYAIKPLFNPIQITLPQERLLREEALHDSKSPKILNLEREITTALKISLQARALSFRVFMLICVCALQLMGEPPGLEDRKRSHL